jgi:hypothetical protein
MDRCQWNGGSSQRPLAFQHLDAGAVGHQGQIAGAAALPLGNLERLGALMGQQPQGDRLFMHQAFRLAITDSRGGLRGGHVRSMASTYNVAQS